MAIEKLMPSVKSNFAQKENRKSNSPMNSTAPGAPRGHRVKKSIPVGVKRLIWKKADNKCENCSSTFALEIDHIQPKALGGTNHAENLRLLCRSCNQRSAIERLGHNRMQQYL